MIQWSILVHVVNHNKNQLKLKKMFPAFKSDENHSSCALLFYLLSNMGFWTDTLVLFAHSFLWSVSFLFYFINNPERNAMFMMYIFIYTLCPYTLYPFWKDCLDRHTSIVCSFPINLSILTVLGLFYLHHIFGHPFLRWLLWFIWYIHSF